MVTSLQDASGMRLLQIALCNAIAIFADSQSAVVATRTAIWGGATLVLLAMPAPA
ncbi:MAG TPA: hypothetical protein VFE47_19345 [Tepidisphaeraceae bacterium]|jgi:hypothetical protein|nr:hypothetical protein [Tepidisphaeraceae bacterium]